jgi:octaprenyl-diphosphate synthase
MDINWHKDKTYIPSKTEYMTMVGLKTGTLASLSAKVGMICGGATEEKACEVAEIARKIGIGFQVLDDVINLTTGNKGKKRGDDVVEGKKSLPVILHIESKPEDLEKLVSCFERAAREGADSPAVEECIKILESSGAIEKAKSISKELIEGSCESLKSKYQNSEISLLISELFTSMLL